MAGSQSQAGAGGVGQSDVSKAFDAQITVQTDELGLFFVMGRRHSPRNLIARLGGQVVVELPDRRKVLAVCTRNAREILQAHREIALAGQVSVDPVRFSRFAALAGLDLNAPGE